MKELKQLQKDLAKAISTFEDRQKAEAGAKLDALAKEMGNSLADLVGVEVKALRMPAAAKYRHSEDAALTWFGRGRRPRWFVGALGTGYALPAFHHQRHFLIQIDARLSS